MRTPHRILGLLTAATLAVMGLIILPDAANASTPTASGGVSPNNACDPNYRYVTSKTGSDNHDMVRKSSGQPGTDLSISLTAGLVVTATFTGALQSEESLIIVSAKETISASIALSLQASITYTYHWLVPTTWKVDGFLHVGAKRDIISWKKEHDSPTCSTVVDKSGTSHAPYQLPYSWHGTS